MPLWKAVELQSDNFWEFKIHIIITHRIKNKRSSWCYNLAVKPKKIKHLLLEVFDKEGTPSKEFLIDPNKKEDISIFFDYIYNGLEKALTTLEYPLE